MNHAMPLEEVERILGEKLIEEREESFYHRLVEYVKRE